jgi:hypothetical protein
MPELCEKGRVSLPSPACYNTPAFDMLRLSFFYFKTFSFTISIRVSLTFKISIS